MWLSSGCSVAQFRVQCGTVQGAAWLSTGCSMAKLKGVALLNWGCSVGQPLIIPLRPFQFFLKICGDIRSSRCTTSVKWKKSEKFSLFLLGTFGKFVSGVVDTVGNLPLASLTLVANLLLVSLTPVANLPPASSTPAELVAKFATGVVDTGGAPWLANIFANFWKKFEMNKCYFQGLGGRWFMKKSEAKKFVTLSL